MLHIPDGSLDLSAVWPGVSYRLNELMTANLFNRELSRRFKSFAASNRSEFPYCKKAVRDFNEWIRFRIPRYTGYSQITDLSDLPLSSKQEFSQSPSRFRSTDHDPESSWTKRTTGSTGPPQAITYSCYFHHETTMLAVPKIAYRLGLTPGADNKVYSLTLRDKPAEEPILRFDTTGYGGLAIRLGVDTTDPKSVQRALAASEKVRPFCISSTPSVLTILSETVSPEAARRVGVRLLVSGGGALPAETRTRLEQIFRVKISSAYGLSEVGVVASECKHGRMHFNTSDCYPELLPADASPRAIPARGASGEIVITSTTNRLMPFLRYRTGDTGLLSREQCPCGEPSPTVGELRGRINPVFRLPCGKLLSSTQFRDTFDKFCWLKEFQVIQESIDHIRVLYEVSGDKKVSPGEEQSFRDHFCAVLGKKTRIALENHSFEKTSRFQRYQTFLDQSA